MTRPVRVPSAAPTPSTARDPTLARRLGEAARREVVAAHGWPQVARCVAAVYAAVLEARP